MEQIIQPTVQIQQYFDASPEAVFEAWSKPALIRQWMFKSDSNEILHVFNYLQPNGAFSIVEKTEDGAHIDHFGKYYWIVKPNFLSFSLKVPKQFPGVTSVSIGLNAKEKGCELHFQQTGVRPELVERSWQNMFQTLDAVLCKH